MKEEQEDVTEGGDVSEDNNDGEMEGGDGGKSRKLPPAFIQNLRTLLRKLERSGVATFDGSTFTLNSIPMTEKAMVDVFRTSKYSSLTRQLNFCESNGLAQVSLFMFRNINLTTTFPLSYSDGFFREKRDCDGPSIYRFAHATFRMSRPSGDGAVAPAPSLTGKAATRGARGGYRSDHRGLRARGNMENSKEPTEVRPIF